MQKKIGIIEVLGAFIAPFLVLTACGQNPHVLGKDPVFSDGVRGPAGEAGTKTGEGKGKGQGKEDDAPTECLQTHVVLFPSRALRPDEEILTHRSNRGAADERYFATDLALPQNATVQGLSLVRLSFESDATQSSAGDQLCLIDRNVCAETGVQDLSGLDLVATFKGLDWTQVLTSGPVLRWSVPATWGMSEALLSVVTVEDHCEAQGTPKPTPAPTPTKGPK